MDSHALLYTVSRLDRKNHITCVLLSALHLKSVLCSWSSCQWQYMRFFQHKEQQKQVVYTNEKDIRHRPCRNRHLQSLQGLQRQVMKTGQRPRPSRILVVTNVPCFLDNKLSFRCQFLQQKNNMGESTHDGSSASGKKYHFSVYKCPFLPTYRQCGSYCTWLTQVLLLPGWWKWGLPVTFLKQGFKYCFFRSNIKLTYKIVYNVHTFKWNSLQALQISGPTEDITRQQALTGSMGGTVTSSRAAACTELPTSRNFVMKYLSLQSSFLLTKKN